VINRRTFLLRTGGAVLGVSPFAVVGYTLGVEPHWLEIVRRDLPVRNLPAELDGKTLAHISDVHVGPRVSDEYLAESMSRIRQLSPDMVVYTGDFLSYVHERGRAQFDQLRGFLSVAPSGALGTFAVLGNHDYGRNWSEPDVATMVAAEVERAGIRLLRNDVATVSGLDIVGIDDLWAHRADTKQAVAKRQNAAVIALCHNPDGLDLLDWTGFEGWVLAGHTHGGQCKPPFLRAPLLPVQNKKYSAGVVEVDAARTLYISRGVGHLLKARFNVRPEITMFTLRRAT
jgi:predicted MPP superfamily phosphohydrolase